MTDEVVKRLDRMISILQLAYSTEIASARDNIRTDPVNSAVLELTADDYVQSGDIKRKVAAQTKQSEKTVQRRISELVDLGALERRPSGVAAFKSTGLI